MKHWIYNTTMKADALDFWARFDETKKKGTMRNNKWRNPNDEK